MKKSFIYCLMSILLSGSIFAQNSGRKLFVGIDGPVKSVSLEVSKLTSNGDSVVEGPRILTGADEANEDGTLIISRRYRPDGVVNFKQVTTFHPNGRADESLVYSSEERLSTRMLYFYESSGNRIESFYYDIDGTIASKSIKYLDESLSLISSETRDKSGNLREQEVSNRTDSGISGQQTRSLYKENKISGKVVTVPLSAQKFEQQIYDAEGVLKSKNVITVDRKGEWVERATYDGEGNLREKDSYERKYDERGNWIKYVLSKWNPQTEKSEATQVFYRTITYY